MSKGRKKGFTLIDMMIGISIFAIIAGTMSLLLRKTYQTYSILTAVAGITLEGQTALERIARQTRQSLTVSDSFETYSTGSQQIVLQMAGLTSQQQILPSTYDYIIYRTDPNDAKKLQEIVVADAQSSRTDATRTVSDNVSSWAIEYHDSSGAVLQSGYTAAKEVRIVLSLSKEVHGQTKTHEEHQTIQLRNQ